MAGTEEGSSPADVRVEEVLDLARKARTRDAGREIHLHAEHPDGKYPKALEERVEVMRASPRLHFGRRAL